jgi:hypothetical protein
MAGVLPDTTPDETWPPVDKKPTPKPLQGIAET